ncbi:MAG: isoprenyl transferase [Planctomycetales bacterium]|nr:isoprenyl transferase [Planctomycetales bacterium]
MKSHCSFEEKRSQAGRRLGISPEAIPGHIAIIMDGNGRWAVERGLPRFHGHEQGAETVKTIAQHCVDTGVEYLTLYSFSMQNWKRPKEEVDFLMYLYAAYLEGIRPSLMENNVRLAHLGRRNPLPQTVLDALDETIAITGVNTGMTLGLALNYGSRTEIVDAVRALAQQAKDGQIDPQAIDEQDISSHLYTAGWRDPDLIVRTSGEMRISNYLLWQVSYAEFYVTNAYWPDFTPAELDKAILAYAGRQRRFGDVKPKNSL